jgi:hypothetical protein
MSTLWLERDGDGGVCWCACDRSPAAVQFQAACPWCGCGWLLSCAHCRKAFTFARAVERPETLEELARNDVTSFLDGTIAVTSKMVTSRMEVMRGMQRSLQPGQRYVYPDGCFVRVTNDKIVVRGAVREHRFDRLPHLALSMDPRTHRPLSDPSYWRDRQAS